MHSRISDFLSRFSGWLIIVAFSLAGWCIYQHFGVSWDEPTQRETGLVSYNYIFKSDPALLTHVNRDYGVAFELPLILLEKALDLTRFRDIFFMRHLVTHLFFLFGVGCLYALILRLYHNRLYASAGSLILLLSPVIYGHSFFNSKDIPFLSLFIVCFLLLHLAASDPSIYRTIAVAAATGLLINIRIMGILFAGIVILHFVLDITTVQRERKTRPVISLVVYLLVSSLVLYLTWPTLWDSPVQNFLTAFRNMSKFRWESGVLFNGRFIPAPELPWYYLPVSFIVTTPPVYLVAGFAAIILFLSKVVRNPNLIGRELTARFNLFFVLCFFGPVIAVIVLKSVVYDGWRQLFFIYPSFVLLMIYGLNTLAATRAKRLLPVILTGVLLLSGSVVVFTHPFQYAYYNELAGTSGPDDLRHRFEADYWGVAYKQGLEHILKNDTSSLIRISSQNPPCDLNLEMLPEKDRERFRFAIIAESDYFLTNYRWHPENYTEKELVGKEWVSLKAGGNNIHTIFRLKD